MNKKRIWTTAHGEKLDMAWMTSPHLAHSFNLVLRNNKLSRLAAETFMTQENALKYLSDELKARTLFVWQSLKHNVVPAVVHVPERRENTAQLCLMRAILDCGLRSEFISRFIREHQYDTSRIAELPDEVKVKFTEYRLMHA